MLPASLTFCLYFEQAGRFQCLNRSHKLELVQELLLNPFHTPALLIEVNVLFLLQFCNVPAPETGLKAF
jgi:hypothetical protein